jgi:hypothetical protein
MAVFDPTLKINQNKNTLAALRVAERADEFVKLNKLIEARDNGQLRFRMKLGSALENEYFFRSIDDLQRVIHNLERKLGVGRTQRNSIVVHSHKGWLRRGPYER